MRIPILIEPTAQHRYRASACEPLVASVEGDSPEAVMEKMKQQIDARLAQGAVIKSIELPEGENPWLSGVGMFRNEPLFDQWQEAMAEYRREANRRTEAP